MDNEKKNTIRKENAENLEKAFSWKICFKTTSTVWLNFLSEKMAEFVERKVSRRKRPAFFAHGK